MNKSRPRNLEASVKNRLLQRARDQGEEFQSALTRYAIERFLYRLSLSPYRRQFILKGANLFVLWTGTSHRPTRDLDLLGFGNDEITPLVRVFQNICRQPAEEDRLIFEASTVTGDSIHESAKYSGVRVVLQAALGKAVIPLQIDIGFGDVITPAAQEMELPASLNLPQARLLTYLRETVIAEKCEALIDLGFGEQQAQRLL